MLSYESSSEGPIAIKEFQSGKNSNIPKWIKATEVAIKISINKANPKHKEKIGSGFSNELQEELVRFLMKNKKSFVWTMKNMLGIDPRIICHELHVHPSLKPIKQKRGKLSLDRAKAVNDE